MGKFGELKLDESKIEIRTERQVKVGDILIDVPLRKTYLNNLI